MPVCAPGHSFNRLIKGVNGRDCEFEDPCLNGGGCQHNCQAVGSLAVCSCYDGFELEQDAKSCSDVDECVSAKGKECAGSCINTEGSFYCSCPPGYELGNDGFKCYRVVMELISRKRVSTTSTYYYYRLLTEQIHLAMRQSRQWWLSTRLQWREWLNVLYVSRRFPARGGRAHMSRHWRVQNGRKRM